MNDAATASSTAPHLPTIDQTRSTELPDDGAHADQDAEEQQKRIVEKKAANLKSIIRDFDILVYAQLAAVYYMDTSFLRFLFRAFMQLLYFTPKPPLVPTPPMKDRPFIGAIFGSNILCIILHVYLARPAAGEATRGYLHGGLLIDFVGQKGPTPKWLLVLLDMGITVLQMIMLAAVVEERELETYRKRKHRRRRRRSGTDTAEVSTQTVEEEQATQQDHDAEERGARRSTEAVPLLTTGRITDLNDPAATTELLDRLRSGQAITTKFYILDTIGNEWHTYSENRRTAPSTASSSNALTAALARTNSMARMGFRGTGNGG